MNMKHFQVEVFLAPNVSFQLCGKWFNIIHKQRKIQGGAVYEYKNEKMDGELLKMENATRKVASGME